MGATRTGAMLGCWLVAMLAAAEPAVRAPVGAERAAIGDYIRARAPALQDCYEGRLSARGTLAGRLVLRFDILGDGSVSNPEADGIKDAPLIACVVGEMRNWKFASPAQGQVLRVAYPITFRPPQ